jgi:hypothetical protein
LTVGAGRLSPVDALQAAASCAGQIRAALIRSGVELTERPCPNGLVELVVGAAAPPTSAVASVATTKFAPAPMAQPPAALGADPAPASSSRVPGTAAPGGEGLHSDPQVERAVARVFSDLLKGPVDVTTPYFRLGASSLTLVMAHRSLREEIDPELTVVELFANPTVRQTAALISERQAGVDAAPARPGPAQPPPLRFPRAEARARAAELVR